MTTKTQPMVLQVVERHEQELLAEWMNHQLSAVTMRADLLGNDELRDQSRRFLAALKSALAADGGQLDVASPPWKGVRETLDDLSRARIRSGFTASETATFIFSLKQPLFNRLQQDLGSDSKRLGEEVWQTTVVLDKLGLYTVERAQQKREEVISRQQAEMLELSTPVVQLWEGILALPLVGTLDSNRTQIVMETLLQQIVDSGAGITIIDITGVPTVDTLVAQHLLKTVAAARLLGAECIISGIRPQIAQTIVHLGVELGDMVTKATLADAFAVALQRRGLTVSVRGS